jgi:hypothetical protein
MKILKSLLISALLAGPVSSVNAAQASNIIISELPAKTVCIKHPEAADANKFFVKANIVMFEIYKGGSAEEVGRIVKALEADPNIESAIMGPLTGDFQAVTISLKSNKDKAWFMKQFKKAGLTHIKINNNSPVELEKL